MSTTECAALPQSPRTSFLGYKVMQILYNRLPQPQTYHRKIHFTVISSFLAISSHITQEINQQEKGKKKIATFLVSSVQYTRSGSTTSDCMSFRDFKSYKYIYEQKYTKTIWNTKRINAKWKLTMINFNNLKNEYNLALISLTPRL